MCAQIVLVCGCTYKGMVPQSSCAYDPAIPLLCRTKQKATAVANSRGKYVLAHPSVANVTSAQ